MSRGRPQIMEYPIWSTNPYEPNRRTTCAHISILIKRNPNMTFLQLAEQVAEGKQLPIEECVEVLSQMLDKGHLGYFDDTYTFHRWAPIDRREE